MEQNAEWNMPMQENSFNKDPHISHDAFRLFHHPNNPHSRHMLALSVAVFWGAH